MSHLDDVSKVVKCIFEEACAYEGRLEKLTSYQEQFIELKDPLSG